MDTLILSPNYRDENESTKYPFIDTATLRADTGQQLPVDMFLDASLYPLGGQAHLRLASIELDFQSATLTLGDPQNAALASCTFELRDPPDQLCFLDPYQRPAGAIVSEALRLAAIANWSLGKHSFAREAAEFVASCTIPTPERGLRAILAGGWLHTDHVWLVGDRGVTLRVLDEHTIEINAVGDPLFRRRLCAETFTAPRFLRTINQRAGDLYGEYKLHVGDWLADQTVLRLYQSGEGVLRIETVAPGG